MAHLLNDKGSGLRLSPGDNRLKHTALQAAVSRHGWRLVPHTVYTYGHIWLFWTSCDCFTWWTQPERLSCRKADPGGWPKVVFFVLQHIKAPSDWSIHQSAADLWENVHVCMWERGSERAKTQPSVLCRLTCFWHPRKCLLPEAGSKLSDFLINSSLSFESVPLSFCFKLELVLSHVQHMRECTSNNNTFAFEASALQTFQRWGGQRLQTSLGSKHDEIFTAHPSICVWSDSGTQPSVSYSGWISPHKTSHIPNMATDHFVDLSPALIRWDTVCQRAAYLPLN